MRRTILLTAAVLLACAPAAGAATLEHTASAGPAAEDYLDYHAGKGERNVVTVTIKKRDLIVTDPGATIKRKKGDFGGCQFLTKHKVLCKKMADLPFLAELGNQSDSFRFKGIKNHLGTTDPEQVQDPDQLGDVYEDDEGAIGAASIIDGGPGNDSINGSDGHDEIFPGTGRDSVDGGDGNDLIVVSPDKAGDRLLGGRGIDTVEVTGKKAVSIDLDANELTAGSEDDLLDGFERARGGAGADTLTGSGGSDGLFGGGGGDTIDGGAGDDYLGADLESPVTGSDGDPGADKLTGGAGDDVLDGRARTKDATDTLDCGDGSDRIIAQVDDLETACESSEFGLFTGDPIDQTVFPDALSGVMLVARGAESGNPVYSIACPAGHSGPCIGTVTLQKPPDGAEVWGTGSFSIAAGTKANVEVTLNSTGAALPVRRSVLGSIHVGGEGIDFGWQAPVFPEAVQ